MSDPHPPPPCRLPTLIVLAAALTLPGSSVGAEDPTAAQMLARIVEAGDMPPAYRNAQQAKEWDARSASVDFLGPGHSKITVSLRHYTDSQATVSVYHDLNKAPKNLSPKEEERVLGFDLRIGQMSVHRGRFPRDGTSDYYQQDLAAFVREWGVGIHIYSEWYLDKRQGVARHSLLDSGPAGAEIQRIGKIVADRLTAALAADADRDVRIVRNTPEQCRSMRRKLMERDPERYPQGIVGFVKAATGKVQVDLCTGNLVPAEVKIPIRQGDCVRTGSDGRVRVQLNDRDEENNAGPSIINIASHSELCFDDPLRDAPTQIELISGMVRNFMAGWSRGSSASIKTGVTICGSRGTDYVVRHAPEAKQVTAYVIDGQVEMRNIQTGEARLLKAGEKLSVNDGRIGPPEALSSAEWDSLISRNELDMGDSRQVEETREDADWSGSWSTSWGVLTLRQDGDRVAGSYPHRDGRVEGRVEGRTLRGTWRQSASDGPAAYGELVFTLSPDGSSFTGQWRYGSAGGWRENWNGTRQ